MPGAKPGHRKTLLAKLKATGIKRKQWWPVDEGEHEVAFAFHLDTLEVKWYRGDKAKGDKWKAKFYVNTRWVTGTADWILVRGKTFIHIDDLKTGRWPVTAADNKQLLTYAMPFWLAAEQPLDCEVVLSITQWPKYPLGGLPKRNWGKATGLDMAEHLQDLRYALAHPEEANPSEDHCRFCDSKKFCSAFEEAGFDYGR